MFLSFWGDEFGRPEPILPIDECSGWNLIGGEIRLRVLFTLIQSHSANIGIKFDGKSFELAKVSLFLERYGQFKPVLPIGKR